MQKFLVHEMRDSSVLALNDIRDRIELAPDYQRPGGVWSLKNKQLFIDSLLNGYDIPKLYLHHLTGEHKSDKFQYAIVDGRQRLESIWDFIDGKYALADDFSYYDDVSYNARGMTFGEIEKEYPRLLIRLQARNLAVMVITADDLDLIEEMFSRLNEAVPLNAAEKRNAFGGPLPVIIRELAKHVFFEAKTSVSSTRYRHYDLATKMLYQEAHDKVVNTKKASLDFFVKEHRGRSATDFDGLVARVIKNLDEMAYVFTDRDVLLKSSGMNVVYYVMFSQLEREGAVGDIKRKRLVHFELARAENRVLFENEVEEGVNFRWIEFDTLAQSANDAAAIKERCEIVREFLGL